MNIILEKTEAITSLPLENALAQVKERLNRQFAIKNSLPDEALERLKDGFNELFQAMKASISPSEKLNILARTIDFLKIFQEQHQTYLSYNNTKELQRARLIFLSYSKLFRGSQLLLQSIDKDKDEIDIQVLFNAVELMAQAFDETPTYFPESTYQSIRQIAVSIAPYLTIDPALELNYVDKESTEYRHISLQRQTQRSLSSILLSVQKWEEETNRKNIKQRSHSNSELSLFKQAGNWRDKLKASSWELVIGEEPLEELLRKSQASIHRLDELDPKTEEEAKEQIETFEYLKQQFGWN